MRKRLIAMLAIGALVVSMAGCGTNAGGAGSAAAEKGSTTDEIRATADGFLAAIDSGDWAAAGDYASDEVMAEFDMSEIDGIANDFYSELGMDESQADDATKDAVNNFIQSIFENLITGYEITDVQEDGDTGTVTATITYGFDEDAIDDVNIDAELETVMNDYMSEHMDELMELADDETALMNKILSDLAPTIFELYTDAILETGGKTGDVNMTVEQVDGAWLVTEALIADDSSAESDDVSAPEE